MATIYSLNLLAADVFQILDALNLRAEAYQQAACVMSGSCEADEIAQHFRAIARNIERQIA